VVHRSRYNTNFSEHHNAESGEEPHSEKTTYQDLTADLTKLKSCRNAANSRHACTITAVFAVKKEIPVEPDVWRLESVSPKGECRVESDSWHQDAKMARSES
jgi:hypothetical protein